LKIANAGFIRHQKYEELIERSIILSSKLENKIINLPEKLEKEMNEKLWTAIKKKEKKEKRNRDIEHVKAQNIKMPEKWRKAKTEEELKFQDVPLWQIR
jgi:hypothetical protein